jgi:hypothetical protein
VAIETLPGCSHKSRWIDPDFRSLQYAWLWNQAKSVRFWQTSARSSKTVIQAVDWTGKFTVGLLRDQSM